MDNARRINRAKIVNAILKVYNQGERSELLNEFEQLCIDQNKIANGVK